MFQQYYQRMLRVGEFYKKNSRRVTAPEVTKIIRRQFPAADFSFCTHRDSAVDPDMIVVAGVYDCFNDAQGIPYVEITLCYHPDQTYYFTNLLDWPQISFDIAECIGHELVHQAQYQRRAKLKPYKSEHAEQQYLGDEGEIEAYGFSIAAEMIVFNKLITECAMYNVYKETFDNDHSVVIKLEKQISKYLIQLGANNEQSNRPDC